MTVSGPRRWNSASSSSSEAIDVLWSLSSLRLKR